MINTKKTIPYSYKRLIILMISIVGVCFYFWTQSRYPALDKKALMGGRTSTGSIVFDILIPLVSGDNAVVRILKTTVNWYFTNWKGMTFGLIFSGLVICTLSMFKFKGFKNRYLNALAGMVFGAPLGVCANCAAPISRSLYDTTKSIEATLSSLFSSPTFNFVVLTMAFQMLPFELAITKTVLALLMILIVSPVLGKAFRDSPEHLKNLSVDDLEKDFPKLDYEPKDVSSESWLSALLNSVLMFLQGLYHICKVTVPMMLLAGFLGASIIEMIPLDSLINFKLTIWGVVLVAAVGTFLPVPMSFDVVIVSILMHGGLNPVYGMILLFTLGIFSVYPFMVMWRTINLKFAGSLYAAVMIAGILGGSLIPVLGYRNVQNLMSVYNSQGTDPIFEVIESVKKTCLTIQNPEKGNCVFQIAQAISKKEICSVLVDQVENKKCTSKYFGAKLDSLKGETCEMLSDKESIDYCNEGYEHQVFKEIHFMFSRTCEAQSNQKKSDICLNFDTFMSSRSIAECEKYKDPNQVRVCLNYLLRQRYTPRNMDPKICSPLKTELGQSFCQYFVGIASDDKDKLKVKNEVCNRSQNKKYQEYCNGFFIESYANKFLQPDACDKITTGFKDKCKSDTYTRMAKVLYYNLTKKSLEGVNLGSIVDEPSKMEVPKLVTSSPVVMKNEFYENNVKVSSFALQPKSVENKFERFEGRELGIVLPDTKVVESLELPFWASRGMAAGDFDMDGRQDLIFATSEGPFLYKNLGGLKFVRVPVTSNDLVKDDLDLTSVALVDIDNDGDLDIYASSVKGAAFFLLSNKSSFSNSQKITLPNYHNRFYVQTTAFADVDKDGGIDIFMGNNPPWGLLGQSPRAENDLIMNNRLIWKKSEVYKDRILNLTMTSLFSDLNQDGNVDLWLGTDLTLPDQLLMGAKGGKLNEIKKTQKIVPSVPDASMSYDSGDINNDLILDVFGGGVDNNPSVFFAETDYCSFVKNKTDNESCKRFEFLIENIKKSNPDDCKQLPDSNERADCFSALFGKAAVVQNDINLCKMIPPTHDLLRNCLTYFSLRGALPMYVQNPEDVPQVTRNVLLVQNKNGKFEDVAKSWGVASTGWAWNSKFNDLNNDGWLDLYVSTGFLTFRMVSNNFLFINKEGKKFENKTKELGLQELYSSFSNVGVDLNNNGNLSIIATATNGPVRFYVNNSNNNSILFNLRQSSKYGNTSAIGARIIITDNLGLSQLREVKASGGFLSFGPYVQHFGLGTTDGIKMVKIIWPDGNVNTFQKPFKANHQYELERI